MNYQDILVEKAKGITTIKLNRPEAMNAVSRRMNSEIRSAIEEAGRDSSCRVLVITASGRIFCSGVDLKEREKGTDLNIPEPGKPFVLPNPAGGLDLALRRVEKPTLAAINGPAVGMGCDLALTCDLRIASEKATFREPYVLIGSVASAGPYYLPRLVGLARTFEMLYLGDAIDAQQAERTGLVNKVVPPEDLEKATLELATRLAEAHPWAIRFIKHAVYTGLEAGLEETLDYVTHARAIAFHTKDSAEALKAYREKRKPTFEGL